MGTARRATLRPYTPSREAPDALEERTVGRESVLDTIQRRLATAVTSRNRIHSLLVGPRGSGKTHVIEVALHRAMATPAVAARIVVARVEEDAVGIATYTDLLVQLRASIVSPEDPTGRESRRGVPGELEADILASLNGRVLLAVIENLDRVFANLGVAGQRDLRSFVETTGQVMLLASTPLLSSDLVSRSQPWFGSFGIEHLSELTLDEGSELLRRLAAQDSDEHFRTFLDGPRGRARLHALHHLAGGSPRLWMVLAGCASVELLDELVPATEELLENLVAYYQQRLWDLPGNEQKLVQGLGRGPAASSVADLAARSGIEERTAATALGRLKENGWVRSEKVPGTDQRTTWYRLREPLLRHHLQYRRPDGEPLRLIIEILRIWFDPSERQLQIAGAEPASMAEEHLAATMSFDPPRRSDTAYADHDSERLLAEVRCWMHEPDTIGNPEAGMLVEAAITAVRSSPGQARRGLQARKAPPWLRERADQLFRLVESQDAEAPTEDRMGAVLDAAARGGSDRNLAVVELVAACWNGAANPARAAARLQQVSPHGLAPRLGLTIRDEYGYWLGASGRHQEALDVLTAVADERADLLGRDHPDTLLSRHNVAYELRETGRHDEALVAFRALVDDRTRVLGPDHPDTLTSRHSLAYDLGKTGRHDEAVAAYSAVVDDRTRVLGAEHPETLAARDNLAYQVGETGRHDEAATVFSAVIDDRTRMLGADHPDTLTSRHNLAFQLGETGRHDEAVAAFSAVVDDLTRVLGADHPETLAARDNLAFQVGQTGRHDEAVAAFSAVVDDRTRVLGADHPDTLNSRHNLAYQVGRTGRPDEAVAAFSAVVDDRTRVLGADHPDTLNSRHNLAYQVGRTGRHDEAVAAFSAVVDDRTRVLGADHPDTLNSRHNLAYQVGRTGRHDEAVAAFSAVVDDHTRVLGADHPRTLVGRHNLAFHLGQTGRHDEAVAAFSAVVDDRTRVLGLDHPRTRASRRNLVLVLSRAGHDGEAVVIARASLERIARNGSNLEDSTSDLVALLIGFVMDGKAVPPPEELGSFGSSTAFRILKDMEAARDGSAEAAVRLPSELRSLVEIRRPPSGNGVT